MCPILYSQSLWKTNYIHFEYFWDIGNLSRRRGCVRKYQFILLFHRSKWYQFQNYYFFIFGKHLLLWIIVIETIKLCPTWHVIHTLCVRACDTSALDFYLQHDNIETTFFTFVILSYIKLLLIFLVKIAERSFFGPNIIIYVLNLSACLFVVVYFSLDLSSKVMV